MKVLAIVDDTPDVRRMVRVLLERSGATVDLEAASIAEVVHRLDPSADGVVILDHHLDGNITGLDGAALVHERAPHARIVLFTSLDLQTEAASRPEIDAFVRKDRVLELPGVVRALSKHSGEAAAPPREDGILATWLVSPSSFFEELPPPVEATEVARQLAAPDAARTETLLRFVAATGDIDHAVAHLLVLRRILDRSGVGEADLDLLDLLIVEATSNVIESARRAAMVDPLTGMSNRRALDGDMASALARSERMRQTLTVIFLDLVGLKRINDRLGHEHGDRALKEFARSLHAAKRSADSAYRVGGDEFVLLLPDTHSQDVGPVIGRLAATGAPEFSWGSADTSDVGYDGARLVRLADIRLLAERYARAAAPATAPLEGHVRRR